MKKIILLIAAFILFPVNVEAGLSRLIQQNIEESDKSFEQTILPIEQQSKPSRLWIHVCTEGQRIVGEKIYKAISDTGSGETHIVEKPLQIVAIGPSESQLRYFKKEDESQAAELFEVLRKFIPTLKLKDFSQEYSHVRWLKKGHFELWLSPELMQIETPE